MKKKSISTLVAISFLLAGCLGGQEEPEPAEDPEAHLDSVPEEQIRPLNITLSANVTSGIAPLDVSFLIESNNTDSQNTTWELEIESVDNANGTNFPAVVNITFEEVGNFTVGLNATSGNQTKQANIEISVLPLPSTDAIAVIIEGTATLGHPGEAAVCVRNEIDGEIHEIAPAEPGWSYQITPVETFSVYWWSEPNPLFAMGGFVDAGEDSGTVPDDATHIEVCLQTGHTMEDYMVLLWDPEALDLE